MAARDAHVTGGPRQWLGSSNLPSCHDRPAMTAPHRHISWLLGLALASACGSPTRPDGEVSAVATAEGIRAANGTSRPVLYLVFEQGLTGAIDFVPCEDVAVCPSIAPGATVTIPWSEVMGYDPRRRTYLLYWHHAAPAWLPIEPSFGQIEVVLP
jgi:hypothetical protein